MKLALNGATTMKADLQTDILAAQAAGFDYLEIWAAKLREFLEYNSAHDLKELFADSGVQPLSINSIEHITFRDHQAYEGIKQECKQLCYIAAKIDCRSIVVVPCRLPENGATKDEIVSESVQVLTELCEIALPYEVTLAFEFLGQTDCSVQTLGLADEIVQATGRDNLGLVLDSFHFYAGGSTVGMIEALNPELLKVFHINDAEDRPRAELRDSHRLLPGLGILPLPEILGGFRRIGYDSVTSVEIFRPEYWEQDPFALARAAHDATLIVLD